jgi:hypothetical protein
VQGEGSIPVQSDDVSGEVASLLQLPRTSRVSGRDAEDWRRRAATLGVVQARHQVDRSGPVSAG